MELFIYFLLWYQIIKFFNETWWGSVATVDVAVTDAFVDAANNTVDVTDWLEDLHLTSISITSKLHVRA